MYVSYINCTRSERYYSAAVNVSWRNAAFLQLCSAAVDKISTDTARRAVRRRSCSVTVRCIGSVDEDGGTGRLDGVERRPR